MNNPLLYLIQKMWHYSRGNKKNVVLFVALSALANLVGALEPLVIGFFLNRLQNHGLNEENLIPLLLILGILPVLEIVFWIFHGWSRIIENKNAFIVRSNYTNFLLGGIVALPLSWHTDHHSGDTIDKIEKGTENLYSFSSRIFEIVQGVIALVTSFIAMLIFDIPAGIMAIVISAITFYILTLFDKKLVPGYKIVNGLENKIAAKIFDALSNVTTVIILRVEKLVLGSIDKFIWKPFDQYHKNNKVNEWKWFSASILGRIAVIVVVGIYLITNAKTGSILVGTVYILYGYANQIRDTFFKFAYLYNDIVRYRTSVFNAEELSKDFLPEEKTTVKKLQKDWKKITVQNLSFSYHTEDGADLHLDNINLEFKKGERIALIGDSGGGKSTFLKILRDVYTPKTLSLSVDKKQVRSGFKGISGSISLIPQDPEIFSTTIRENITLGVEYDDKEIYKLTDMSKFTSVVKSLPSGLESSIVEKGVNLSGGEKQRLALSRGLLASQDKDIILLDEPTSSVDFHNELDIYKNIFQAFPKTTIFSSIHRLHLLSMFDSIYFFKDGKIIAQGNFEQLKQSSKDFQNLWDKYIKARNHGKENI